MAKRRVPALPDSASFQQLWEALGSRLMDAAKGNLPSKQVVAGSSPVSRSTASNQGGTEEEFCLIFLKLVHRGRRRPLAI